MGVNLVQPGIAEDTASSKRKLQIKKIMSAEETMKLLKKSSGSTNGNTGDSPMKHSNRPVTENIEKRKKAGTPTPYSSSSLLKGNSTGKSLTNLKEKTLPLHKQPRQHSATAKGGNNKAEGTRASTPKLGTPKKEYRVGVDVPVSKASNPAPGKTALFYSNLLKVKSDKETTNRAQEKGGHKENNVVMNVKSMTVKAKPCILTGSMAISSNILKGLEEAANKKLNKHSSSLDNTDWMACYEKLRKELNLNSPKDSEPVSGRASMNGIRPNGNVHEHGKNEEKKNNNNKGGDRVPKRLLVTPTPTSNPFSKSIKLAPSHDTKNSKNSKPKPALVTNNGKFANMLMQLGGKQAASDNKGGVQRPVVISHQKK